MSCEEVRELLPAYADGELDAARALAIEKHLAGCAACAARLQEARALSKALGTHAPYHRMPDALRARLSASLPREAAQPGRSAPHRQWLPLGAALAAGMVLALGANLFMAGRATDDRLADEVIAGHVRSLMANHLEDVASSDQHTVKPWFIGKLDFAPPVRDPAARDFPLIGGRLDYIGGRSVAALVYRHRSHMINLFVWPADSASQTEPETESRKGYSLVHWTDSGMNWWAVSDLNAAELGSFAQTLRAPPPPAS